MPELPEVETIVRDLTRKKLIGKNIHRADVSWHKTIATHTPQKFSTEIQGQKIFKIFRRGKFIIFQLTSLYLFIHLRMSGRLILTTAQSKRAKHEHACLQLSDQRELRFKDPRKFGRWYLTTSTAPIFSKLGPEPLDTSFLASHLHERLKNRKRSLKATLLDQSIIAGLGNIYVDEALWEARLHPEQPSCTLTAQSTQTLHAAIGNVLHRGIQNLGTSLGKSDTNYYSVSGRAGRNQDQLHVFRKTGTPCPRCATIITRIRVAQRGTHLCLKCQRPKIS